MKCTISQPVLQNIPFVNALALSVLGSNTEFSTDVLPTILFLVNLSTLITAIAIYLLGHFNLGVLVDYIPSSFLRGVMGGLGLFLLQTGIEAAAPNPATAPAARHALPHPLWLEGILRRHLGMDLGLLL